MDAAPDTAASDRLVKWRHVVKWVGIAGPFGRLQTDQFCNGQYESANDAVDGADSCGIEVALGRTQTALGEASMGEVCTIGLDVAKSVFQVHWVDGSEAVVIRKRVSRAKVLEFFAACHRAQSGSKLAGPRIIGATSCKRLVT